MASLYILQPPTWKNRWDGMLMKILSFNVGDEKHKKPANKWPSAWCDKGAGKSYVEIGGYMGQRSASLDELTVYYDACNEHHCKF
ncbi:hypothetical protein BLA29_013377 [Euroglyphus maynei]|uniref:Uncharacterized protein n=1 Tax=Euroglyphus maynei TaxID=6958 RepID=A0A1Y3B5Q5_EURMA|nr:hypothetical protein BLA29_013377 [Euroglyphus maynei]